MNEPLEELAISANVLIKLADFIPYPFIIAERTDGRNRHIYFNQIFLEEIGYTCEEIPDQETWFNKAYPDPLHREEAIAGWRLAEEEARRGGKNFVMSKALVTCRSNEQRWYLIKSSVIGNYHLVGFIDLTKEMEMQDSLIHMNHNKDRLLSILSHDLRGPITNLFTISSLATSGDLTQDEFACMAQLIYKQSFQVLELLDTTLNWAKSNYSSFKMEKKQVDLEQLINRALGMYRNVCENKKLVTSVKLGKLRYINTDAEILTVVIRNIISNAIKFTPESGSVEISTTENEIIIKDSGIGMSKRLITDILTKKYASRKGTNDELGIGMGLNLVLDLVKLIHCELEIESEPALGTVMRLKF